MHDETICHHTTQKDHEPFNKTLSLNDLLIIDSKVRSVTYDIIEVYTRVNCCESMPFVYIAFSIYILLHIYEILPL